MATKILMLGDSPTVATGYGRVMKELGGAFHQAGFEIKVVGRGYDKGKHDFPFEIIGHTPQDRFGIESLKTAIYEWHPDVVFTLGDIWMLDFIPSLTLRDTFKWVCYYPFDGVPIPLKWRPIIKNIDHHVMFSKFAYDLLSELVTDKPIELIYHGVDTQTFRPLAEREALRKKSINDKFIVGMVARNQPRKNIPALVRTFKRFKEGKHDVGLYLHTTLNDIGWDMVELLKQHDVVEDTYLTTGMNDASCSVTDEQLNRIYNLFNVFALPTCGEGFGLPILEAQSCGIPVVVTNYSACTELTVDPLELLKVKTFMVMNHQCIDQALVDEDDMLTKLEFFYDDWKRHHSEEANRLGNAGRELALSLTWATARKQFVDYMLKITSDISTNSTPKRYSLFMKV